MPNIDNLADRHERLRERHKHFFGEHRRRVVCLVGDAEFLRTFAGQVTWALLLNLTARLYKGIERLRIDVVPGIDRRPSVFFPNQAAGLREASFELLRGLEQGYALEEGPPPPDDPSWIVVHVGGIASRDARVLTVAGAGWLAFINDDSWREIADHPNPVGPMVAGCLAAAEIYKRLYSMHSEDEAHSFVFSAYDYSRSVSANPVLPERIELSDTYVAGAGAVGMALLGVLTSIPALVATGELAVVDFDILDDTNLNRCVLALLSDIGRAKLEVVTDRIEGRRLGLKVFPEKWQEFVARPKYRTEGVLHRVVSCVDRYEARRAVQFDRVPKLLLTAGTGDFLLSLSRHVLDDGLSCGLCYQVRDRDPGCATASDGAGALFETPIDPSIGFVSALAGVLLGGELLKELVPDWHASRVRNTARVGVLFGQTKILERIKDPACNCSSKFVAAGYREIWGAGRQGHFTVMTPDPCGTCARMTD
jgi:molybdopterin/thiamine biosynthesis adenylyltransferase